jgi:hypothetical protein
MCNRKLPATRTHCSALATVLFCSLMLVALFFFTAVLQHSRVDYGLLKYLIMFSKNRYCLSKKNGTVYKKTDTVHKKSVKNQIQRPPDFLNTAPAPAARKQRNRGARRSRPLLATASAVPFKQRINAARGRPGRFPWPTCARASPSRVR